MVIHWGTLMKNLARFSADTADSLGDQNHTLGQLHKQKISQDIHHPSSLNFEWGRAFFFPLLPEVSTFVRCTNEPWSADEVLKHLWHNEYVWQTCWSCFEQGGKNADKINIILSCYNDRKQEACLNPPSVGLSPRAAEIMERDGLLCRDLM